jgi:hypothetical protein
MASVVKEDVLVFLTTRRDYYQALIDKIEALPDPTDAQLLEGLS